MWTCSECSFAYNPATNADCEICALPTRPDGGHNADHRQVPDVEPIGSTGQLEEASVDCWECQRCTLNNPQSTNMCLVCGTEKLIINNGAATGAVPKPRPVPKPRTSIQAASAQWACQKCTLLNDNQYQRCLACKERRPTGAVPKMQDTSKKTDPPKLPTPPHCPACTFKNESSATTCHMCGYALASPRAGRDDDGIRVYGVEQNRQNNPTTTGIPVPATSSIRRMESVLMNKVREDSEKKARDLWSNIIKFCKEVSLKHTVYCHMKYS